LAAFFPLAAAFFFPPALFTPFLAPAFFAFFGDFFVAFALAVKKK
jgi:hypothetical protein